MAYKYAISFRLKNAICGGYSYSERLESLVEQIRRSDPTWEEPTSFALFQTPETIEQLVDRIYLRSHFCAASDLMIVIDIERGVAATKGKVDYPATLRSLINNLAQR
jgi:hypothetical protein